MASYCVACGASLPDDARFCSSCGKAVVYPGAIAFSGSVRGPLTRPRAGRKIAGVCQGLANQYGWDVTWTRVIAVLLGVFGFPVGLLVYALFWLLMPEEPLPIPATTNLNTVT
ncbi:MAG TPA: PspC domain-containing protein [Acidobacteriaceae bacterium]|nr:PspC domain-containing protein [Acidobacteriaceae bacterium]